MIHNSLYSVNTSIHLVCRGPNNPAVCNGGLPISPAAVRRPSSARVFRPIRRDPGAVGSSGEGAIPRSFLAPSSCPLGPHCASRAWMTGANRAQTHPLPANQKAEFQSHHCRALLDSFRTSSIPRLSISYRGQIFL